MNDNDDDNDNNNSSKWIEDLRKTFKRGYY